MVPGVRQHVLVPERSQPVEDKRLDDGGIAVVLAAVDDDRGSRAVALASLLVRVDVVDHHERRHLNARHLHRNSMPICI